MRNLLNSTIATVCWIMLAIVLFCMPTAIPVTPVSMNYASVVFMGFASISVIWYIIKGRKHFTGPPVPVDVTREDQGQVVGLDRSVTEHDDSTPEEAHKKNGEYAAGAK